MKTYTMNEIMKTLGKQGMYLIGHAQEQEGSIPDTLDKAIVGVLRLGVRVRVHDGQYVLYIPNEEEGLGIFRIMESGYLMGFLAEGRYPGTHECMAEVSSEVLQRTSQRPPAYFSESFPDCYRFRVKRAGP